MYALTEFIVKSRTRVAVKVRARIKMIDCIYIGTLWGIIQKPTDFLLVMSFLSLERALKTYHRDIRQSVK